MFGRKKHRRMAVDTMIGPNSKVVGDIFFDGGCHIDGAVKGNVNADSEGRS